jgi:hypothetical protein
MADLVGRAQELARLSAFVAACRGGPVALTIEGEPGIGKTALFERAITARAVPFSAVVLGGAVLGAAGEDEFAVVVGTAEVDDVASDDEMVVSSAASPGSGVVLGIAAGGARLGVTAAAVTAMPNAATVTTVAARWRGDRNGHPQSLRYTATRPRSVRTGISHPLYSPGGGQWPRQRWFRRGRWMARTP